MLGSSEFLGSSGGELPGGPEELRGPEEPEELRRITLRMRSVVIVIVRAITATMAPGW